MRKAQEISEDVLDTASSALSTALVEAEDSIRETRQALWVGHGHDGLYGDDGEMQCSVCRADYKRDPLPDLVRKALKAARPA